MSNDQSGQRVGRRLIRARLGFASGLLLTLLLYLSGCADTTSFINTPSMLDARGAAADRILFLWWVMFGLGTVIFLGVMAYLLLAMFRSRREDESEDSRKRHGKRAIVWGGLVLPTVVIVFLFALTVGVLAALEAPPVPDTHVIEVVGRQWWWEVNYPALQFTTANEIHIPVGEPVQVKVTSEDVIHSFWVPQLNGKIDANPGRVNTIWLQADEPGTYFGQCAEFCGVQHAKMRFLVVAEEKNAYLAWIEQQQLPAPQPEDGPALEGQQVFLSSNCINCHTIRGTNATGNLGPDLTHLAGRLALGAGAIPNTRGNLGGWIADPHGVKPGNLMPPATELSGAELTALLAYLETLR
ncbi:MAG TPA: cytochrome c oxidase subunit II [Anaerolineales bacterium]|nr:cytochrome c oxidase subunit II [Anaerolineales bacterium]